MRIFSIAAVGALAVGALLFGPVTSAAQSDAPHKKVIGYQDPETGEFHALEKLIPDAAVAPTTGEYEVTFTITLKTPVPAGGSVLCSTNILVTSVNLTTAAAASYTESSYAVAKVTGATATCTVNTPYSWVLPPASATTETTLAGEYTASIYGAPGTGVNVATIQGRSSSSSFLSAKAVPASGTTTKLAVNATL